MPVPEFAKNLDLTSEKDRLVIEDGIDCIRYYADRLHHRKEEDILFTYFDDTADIFQVIYEDHKRARSFLQEMLRALDEKNTEMLVSNMLEYAVLLEEHIHKKNEMLFPWLDSKLTQEQKEELITLFEQSDRSRVIDDRKYPRFIEGVEQRAN